MKLIEGQIIHSRYRLEKRVAQGGMGEVWKAYDLGAKREVAVKALRGDLEENSSRLERMRIEAKNSAYLAHPAIAALFDYYENNRMGFLIMEYIPWPSLAQIYKEAGRIAPKKLLPLISQVAKGLYVAHKNGVIHRDIKPANIMVSPEGKVKITDFGVSYSADQAQITQAGRVVGTAQYIAPEQARGLKPLPQSDIYSLGIVLYEGLSGHRPFTGTAPVDIAAAQVNDPVPSLPFDIPEELASYVMVMLEKNPAHRPRSALDVANDLDHILEDIKNKVIPRKVCSYPHPVKYYIHTDAMKAYRLMEGILPSTDFAGFEKESFK
ncbi:MAG: serine/threonine protein kinase [Aeriscardovia sp.]|nr:serine/threonine protein kinase [Aeriscardovia sp.]